MYNRYIYTVASTNETSRQPSTGILLCTAFTCLVPTYLPHGAIHLTAFAIALALVVGGDRALRLHDAGWWWMSSHVFPAPTRLPRERMT